MNQATLHELQTALTREHDTLVKELKEIARPNPQIAGDWNATFPKFEPGESGSHVSEEEASDEVEEYETNLAAEHSLESRLLSITNALARIKNNGYGVCKTCGKPIPLERLRANPAAEFDITHSDTSS